MDFMMNKPMIWTRSHSAASEADPQGAIGAGARGSNHNHSLKDLRNGLWNQAPDATEANGHQQYHPPWLLQNSAKFRTDLGDQGTVGFWGYSKYRD